MSRVARRFVVSGRVQGVGFRFFTLACAARAGIDGWVRNLPDGRVEAEASGAARALDEFARDLAAGPRGARVEHVEMTEIEPFETPDGFRIR